MPPKQKNPLEEVLGDIEKDCLARLAEDELLINTLKKVFLFGIYYNGTLVPNQNPKPLMNFALQIDQNNIMTDDQLGKVLRAKIEGVIAVEVGFKELEKFKRIKETPKEQQNLAR